jgi:hypothetical protein
VGMESSKERIYKVWLLRNWNSPLYVSILAAEKVTELHVFSFWLKLKRPREPDFYN